MDQQEPSYRREFWKSPHHVGLAVLTLGLGFMSAHVLGLIAGATAYVVGWIYAPDFSFFRRWVDRRKNSARQAAEAQNVTEFLQRRDALLRSLPVERRERYAKLAQVCRDIEAATADNPLASPDASTDPRLRKLDELMWTYLRLQGIENSLEQFLETEKRENVPALVKEAEAEAAKLTAEVGSLKAKGNAQLLETRQRLLGSRLERMEVLRKREQRFEQAEANVALVVSEQERLDQQIKLIRADAVASKNAETLTARIDATVEHLDETNKWLSEMDEFKDLVGDMPATDQRIGYSAAAPASLPPVIEPARQKQSYIRQKQTQ